MGLFDPKEESCMHRILTALVMGLAAVFTGCSAVEVEKTTTTTTTTTTVAAGPVVEPENYDEGKWLINPFYYWGQISEKSGYPYQGVRIGCDLHYWPSINYCKYYDHPERLIRIDRVFETDAQGFTDDWDLLMLQDRPTYLTRWYLR